MSMACRRLTGGSMCVHVMLPCAHWLVHRPVRLLTTVGVIEWVGFGCQLVELVGVEDDVWFDEPSADVPVSGLVGVVVVAFDEQLG